MAQDSLAPPGRGWQTTAMAKAGSQPDDESDQYSTLEFIAEARRPLLVQRHKHLVEEMESSLSDMLVTGEADNPRLHAILKMLDSEGEKTRIGKTLRTLAEDAHYAATSLRDALVEELCLLREQGSIEIATLQMHVIGVYREVRRRMGERTGAPPDLAELRPLPVPMLTRLLNPIPARFGTPGLLEALVFSPTTAERTLTISKRIRKAVAGDQHWQDSAGEPVLPRAMEEPLEKLPETERRTARQLLIRDRIRSGFYRQVFVEYFDRDTLDPRDVDAYPTVLRWLEAVEQTPHLFPFMQGQTTAQKIWRLAQLQTKLIQLHEIYARLTLAGEQPALKEQFAGRPVREQLAIMAKAHYPPIPLSNELTLAVLLCPFAAFVEWVQDKLASHDFVVPPDPKGTAERR